MITAPEPALMLVMVKSNYCVFMNQSVAFDFVLSKPMYWNIDKMKVCCVNMIRIKIECVTWPSSAQMSILIALASSFIAKMCL